MEEKIINEDDIKLEKFSYSKLSTYEGCPWKYKLKYIDKKFVDTSAIATDFGTLVHYIEETIARDIVNNNNEPYFMIDSDKYVDLFINADIHDKETILGIKKIKEKYPNDFYEKDKNGLDYNDKANIYLETGIKRLQKYLSDNPDLKIIGIEQEFNLPYRNYIFHGYIDRVFKNEKTGEIFIEDIKTYSNPLDYTHLTTPLQFVFYSLAAAKLYNTENISCAYELILCDQKQQAGTKNYIKRGLKKIDSLLDNIEIKEFTPKPSPLCHWCEYCITAKNHSEDLNNLCPYYMKWTRENKNSSSDYYWMGLENHDAICKQFIEKYTSNLNNSKIEVGKNDIKISLNERFFRFRI